MSTEDEDAQEQPGIGSLGEEALRLLGSLAGWAGQHGAEVHHSAEEVARRACESAQSLADDMDEHLATGAAECTWCPLCRTVHAVRELSPEVKTHLVSAASSLVKAASAILTTVVPDPADPHNSEDPHSSATVVSRPATPSPGDRRRRGRAPGVQHIDIDDPDPAT